MVSRKIRGREIKKNERKKNDFVFFFFFREGFRFSIRIFPWNIDRNERFFKKRSFNSLFRDKKNENFIFKNLDIKKIFRSMGTIFIKFFFLIIVRKFE